MQFERTHFSMYCLSEKTFLFSRLEKFSICATTRFLPKRTILHTVIWIKANYLNIINTFIHIVWWSIFIEGDHQLYLSHIQAWSNYFCIRISSFPHFILELLPHWNVIYNYFPLEIEKQSLYVTEWLFYTYCTKQNACRKIVESPQGSMYDGFSGTYL